MRSQLLKAALLTTLLAGCGTGGLARPEAASATAPAADWRTIATGADRERLRQWRNAWTTALPRARAANAAAIAGGGALFEPDRALGGAMPPPGPYRCRVHKLGAKQAGPEYTAYPWQHCQISDEAGGPMLVSVDGVQRPVGRLFRDSDSRVIFLGTLELGDELSPRQYGQDAARDIAGVVEHVGARRWRMVMPRPAYESLLDVMELVPD